MASKDQVFGLPFLFTGGLPTALEKFTEGNLKCFLIYLIEVCAKATRSNVWHQPKWWNSTSIPYSPIEVDTSGVHPCKVVQTLRNLVLSCYKYYNAERILQVSKQLSDLPRIFLKVRNNGDNTRTLYDAYSKAIYVTVRPENLTYDATSLDKVSKCFLETYKEEDTTFCEIKNVLKSKEVSLYKRQVKLPTKKDEPLANDTVISLSDSSDNEGSPGPSTRKFEAGNKQETVEMVNIIELSDDDNDGCGDSGKNKKKHDSDEDDVQFVEVYTSNNIKTNQTFKLSKSFDVIVLSDSEDDDKDCTMNFTSHQSKPSPTKSILSSMCNKRLSQSRHLPNSKRQRRKSPLVIRNCPDITDLHRVKKNVAGFYEVNTRNGKPRPIPFPPSPPPEKPKSNKYLTKDDFLNYFGLERNSFNSPKSHETVRRTFPRTTQRSLYHKCPLDWFGLLSNDGVRIVFVSKNKDKKSKEPFETYCTTDSQIVWLSIQLNAGDTEESDMDAYDISSSVCNPGTGAINLYRWSKIEIDHSRRRRRAATRLLRSCLGRSPSLSTVEAVISTGSLAPTLTPLPRSALNILLRKFSINMKDDSFYI